VAVTQIPETRRFAAWQKWLDVRRTATEQNERQIPVWLVSACGCARQQVDATKRVEGGKTRMRWMGRAGILYE
jgi:hypothetical protein